MCGGFLGNAIGTQSPAEKARGAAATALRDAEVKAKADAEVQAAEQAELEAKNLIEKGRSDVSATRDRRRRQQQSLLATNNRATTAGRGNGTPTELEKGAGIGVRSTLG